MITAYQLGHRTVEGKNIPPDQSQDTLERRCAALQRTAQSQDTLERRCAALQRTARRQRAALAASNRKIRKYEQFISALDCFFRP
jgi:hypothetical protein